MFLSLGVGVLVVNQKLMGAVVSNVITLDSGEQLDLAAYPLPEGVDDEVFNIELMAQAMNTSTNTISKWISSGMPVVQQGGNGRSYELSFHQCYAWRNWKDAGEAAEVRQKQKNAAQKAMLFRGEDEFDQGSVTAGLSAKEVREWSLAELDRNRAAMARGELVRTADVQRMLEGLLISARNALVNAPDYLEQEFGLNARQVDKAEDYFDGIIDEMRRQIEGGGYQPGEVVSLKSETG